MCEEKANENTNLDESDDWMFEWSELRLVKGEPERWETIRERWEAIYQARLKGETCAVKTDFSADIGALRKQTEGEGDWRVTCMDAQNEQFMGNEHLRLVVGDGSPSIITGAGLGGFAIGKRAFKNCVNLEYVTHLSNMVYFILDEAFAGCRSLRYIGFPFYLDFIGRRAFAGCVMLGSLSLPDPLEVIDEEAFLGCTNLRSLCFWETLPSLLREIRARAFVGCPNLRKVEISSDAPLEYIGESAFEGCAIRELRLPDALKELKPRAFANCLDLELVRLPKRLEPQVAAAFEGCPKVRFDFF